MSDEEDPRTAELVDAFNISPEFGLQYLDDAFRKDLFRYIKRHGRGLDASAVQDVYQQTFLELIPKVRAIEFDWRNPLPLVYTIACRRAIDAAKGKGFLWARKGSDEAIPFIANDLKDTRIGAGWKSLDPLVRKEFRKALDEIIDKLPSKQKIVVVCFKDVYEEVRRSNKYARLAQAVSEVTQKPESVSSVKSALREALMKITGELKRRGYEFLD